MVSATARNRRVNRPGIAAVLALLTLSACMIGGAGQTFEEEVRFQAVAIEHGWNYGTEWWWVGFDESVGGLLDMCYPLMVSSCGGCPGGGYVDPEISPGDRVEVYGLHKFNAAADPCSSVALSREDYYIIRAGSSENQCPVAAFDATPTAGTAPLTVTLTDRAYDPDGTVIWRMWLLDDVPIATAGGTITHVFSNAGTFSICLWIMDNEGCERTECRQIQVSGGTPTEECDTKARGRVVGSPIIDHAPDSGHFTLQVTEVLRNGSGRVSVGQSIEVRVTERASEILAPLQSGDCVEVCGNWDTQIYCWPPGYVREIQCAAESLGCISGQVVDSESREGIAGAIVAVASGPTAASTTSDAAGYFKLCNLKPGQYSITATKTGYTLVAPGSVSVVEGSACEHCSSVVVSMRRAASSKPDLIITGITCTPAEPSVGSRVAIGAVLKNVGTSPAGAFSTAFSHEGTAIGTVSTSGLAAGATVAISLAGWAGTPAWAWLNECGTDHRISGFVDSGKQVAEADENNNEGALQLRIKCLNGLIRDWLIVGPFSYASSDAQTAFGNDYLQGEATVMPTSGTTSGGKSWREQHDSDDYIDFNSLFSPNDTAVAYANVYVNSPREQTVQLRVGSDDAIKVWLNGQLVHENYADRPAAPDQDIKAITLKSGWNRLLVKVLERYGDWGFYARLTDTAGNEVSGLTYSLTPPADEQPDFVGEEFTFHCIVEAELTGQIECSLRYRNDLGENATVLFLFKKAETGEVVGQAAPIAPPGSGQVGGMFECKEPGQYKISWKAFRTSDTHLENPVAGCKSTEQLAASCPCAGRSGFDSAISDSSGGAILYISGYGLRVAVKDQAGQPVPGLTVEGFDLGSGILVFAGSEGYYPGLTFVRTSGQAAPPTGAAEPPELQSGPKFAWIPVIIVAIAIYSVAERIYHYTSQPEEWPFQSEIEQSGNVGHNCVRLDGGDLLGALSILGAGGVGFGVISIVRGGATVATLGWTAIGLEIAELRFLANTLLKIGGISEVDIFTWCEHWYEFFDPGEKVKIPFALFDVGEVQQKQGSIAGTVRDEGGRAVPGARVEVFGKLGTGSKTTDQKGSYVVPGLQIGTGYTVAVTRAAGYKLPPQVAGVEVRENACTTVDFTLQGAGAPVNKGCISGRVVTAAGKGLGGVIVDISGPIGTQRPTGPDGGFRFDGLTVGTYSVGITDVDGYEHATRTNGVIVKEGDCATASFTLTESVAKLPDLRVLIDRVEPVTVCPGGAATVYYTVTNAGRKQSSQCKLGFYFNATAGDTTTDPIHQPGVEPLQPGAAVTGMTSVPTASTAGLPPKTYHLTAFVDSLGWVDETNDHNNKDSEPVRVTTCPGPKAMVIQGTGQVDLVITDPDGLIICSTGSAVPGSTYERVDIDGDGRLEIEVVVPERKEGAYDVRVVPTPEAERGDMYSVTVTSQGHSTRLVENVQVGEIPDLPYSYNGETHSLSLARGMNMIAMSHAPEDSAPDRVFRDVAGKLNLRHWDSSTRSWASVGNGRLDAVAPMEGYWIWVPDEVTVDIAGTSLVGNQALPLGRRGWQQIGVPYDVAWGEGGGGTIHVEHAGETKSLADAIRLGWISGTAWAWDGAAQEWVTLRGDRGATLMPWIGYWIYTYEDDVVLRFFDSPGGSEPVPAGLQPRGAPPSMAANSAEEETDQPLSALRIVSVPNPTGDVTVFEVRGTCTCRIDGLRIEVYDLSGQQVWAGHSASAELPWDTNDTSGEPLPNGIYLAVALVRVDGRWESAPVWKLAIVR